jgi:hypothetical protein
MQNPGQVSQLLYKKSLMIAQAAVIGGEDAA